MTWVKPKFEFVELCSEASACTTGRGSEAAPVRVRAFWAGCRRRLSAMELPLETCEAAARAGVARPRMQSSLAIAGDDGPWFLVNASPDASAARDARAPGRRRPRARRSRASC
jgi:hypothetical protein